MGELIQGEPIRIDGIMEREMKSYGIPRDYMNLWPLLGGEEFEEVDLGILESMQPVPSFEQYVENNPAWDAKTKEYVLQNSRPDKAAKLNKLAQEFNLKLAEIKQEKNLGILGSYAGRVSYIILEMP